jgi:hypothetical protein
MVEHAAVVVVHVQASRDGHLSEVGKASGALSLFFSSTQCREQERGKDGNDSDDNQKFDESEGWGVWSEETQLRLSKGCAPDHSVFARHCGGNLSR